MPPRRRSRIVPRAAAASWTPASVLAAQAARDEAQTAADLVVDQLAIVAPLVDAMPDLLSLDASGLSLAEAEIARVGGVIARATRSRST